MYNDIDLYQEYLYYCMQEDYEAISEDEFNEELYSLDEGFLKKVLAGAATVAGVAGAAYAGKKIYNNSQDENGKFNKDKATQYVKDTVSNTASNTAKRVRNSKVGQAAQRWYNGEPKEQDKSTGSNDAAATGAIEDKSAETDSTKSGQAKNTNDTNNPTQTTGSNSSESKQPSNEKESSCPKCGKPIKPAGSAFCAQCGEKLNEDFIEYLLPNYTSYLEEEFDLLI